MISHKRIAQACCDHLDALKRAEIAQRDAHERAQMDLIKQANRERKKTLSFGRMQYTIPLFAYRRLVAADPELESIDRSTRDNAWARFYRSRISKHFLADGCNR